MITDKLRTANARYFPQRVMHAPKWVVLGVNNVCNLHCKMCDVGTKNLESNFAQNLVGTHPINMPLELIEKVMVGVSKEFPKARVAYAFTEPLVYPHLIPSLEIARDLGLFTTITTNALTLKSKAEALVKAGLNEIYVSLDGPEEIHNEIRGNKKSFQKALEGIRALNEFKNAPRIEIICAITEWNIGHLLEFLDSLKNEKIHKVSFMHTQFADPGMAHLHNQKWGDVYPATASNLDEVDLSKMDLKTLLEEIREIRQNNFPFLIEFSPEIDSMQGLERFYHQPEALLAKHCVAVFTSLMIKSDGSVIPAHGRCFNLTVGNLYEDSLGQIWNSKTFSQFRKDLISEGGLFPGCSRCCSAF